jgi:hypothetical protein
MATEKEIKEHLKIALKEIGKVTPWFDDEVNAWIFSHKSYPVEYAGDTAKEVIKNYPLYLKEFIKERLSNNLSLATEKKTKGRGGLREGAGRPKGSKKEPKKRVYLPKDIAEWISKPNSIPTVRQLMARGKC